MAKHIILVHGRHFKPNANALKRGWIDALTHGVERDCDKRTLNNFKKVKKSMAYYGHLSNAFLSKNPGPGWTKKREENDIADRKIALKDLKQYGSRDFKKIRYKDVKNLSSVVAQALADFVSGPLSFIGVGDYLVGKVAPDMPHYWNKDDPFGSDVRWCITQPLEKALKAGDDVLLIAHSLGTMACYDVLWKFSYYGEYQHIRDKKINTFVTIGSPLADENVKKELKGAELNGKRRFPHNIGKWVNISAHDDYIAHDSEVRNDFKKMVTMKMIGSITDKKVYNMSVRGKHSNPHHGAGYLIHPETIKVVKAWLQK